MMWHTKLAFILGVLRFCAAQSGDRDGAATDSNSTNSGTCETSTADFCVRSCCPPGQNVIAATRSCGASTLDWMPSFLSADGRLQVVGGPIPECELNEELRTFSPHTEAGAQFELQPSGTLTVSTSDGTYDLGHNYCFRNIEHGGSLYETVRSCVPRVVPRVPGLVNIDNVTRVSFHKCCPTGQVFTVNRETQEFDCINDSSDWLPNVLHGDPTELAQLSPEKAMVKAGTGSNSRFECPQNTVTGYLISTNIKYYLQADGRLLVATFNLTLQSDHFCLDPMQGPSPTTVIGHVCYEETSKHTKEEFEELCPKGVCTRKCCAPGFMLTRSDCVPSTVDGWQPTFHDGERVVSPPANYTLLHGMSACDGHNFIFSRKLGEKDVPFLQANGDIQVPRISEDKPTFKAHQCCLDHEQYYDPDIQQYVVVEKAFCCHPKDLEAIIRRHVNSTLLSISAICLFVMLVIYMMVPKLRNVHGKCLMSHAAALFVAFFLTVYNQVFGVALGSGCEALGLMLYYSFIAALFWLNVMSFDIWWTFAHLRTQAPSQRSLRNRFIRHSMYAWGVPLLMTVLVAVLNYVSYDTIPRGAILRPALGERKCFLTGKRQELYYFYVPIFVVTGVNIIFFAATAWSLYQAEKSSRILNRKRTARDRLKVYVNLFIIMEVSWIAECLSSQIGPIQAWYFTDIINASQGLLIFILFIARSSTRQTISERFVELKKRGVCAPRPPAKTDCATSVPTKTTTTATNSSSAARKGSVNEAFQMIERGAATEQEKNGAASPAPGDDLASGRPESTPHDCAC